MKQLFTGLQICLCWLMVLPLSAQTLEQKISDAFRAFEADPRLQNGIVSLRVLHAETGAVIYSKNELIGLAPASTMKTIVAAAAYHHLGSQYQYTTSLSYSGNIDAEGVLHGNILVNGSGDPSLGSDRFENTKESVLLERWVAAIKNAGIKKVEGSILGNDQLFNGQTAPRGWTWQDMGNYYGSGVSSLNWRENAFGVTFAPGAKVGDPISIAQTGVDVSYLHFINEATTGARGTGDRVYAFSAPYASQVFIRGTHGIDLKKTIFLSIPDGAYDAAYQLHQTLEKGGISVLNRPHTIKQLLNANNYQPLPEKVLHTHVSPDLGQIVHWFNQRSVNLYGEALLKTMALHTIGDTDTRGASDMLRDFWAKRLDIPVAELRIMDGSGLSPENRITTHALAKIMRSCRTEPWFGSFYESLPTINGMKMKSGTIGGVLGYTGYQTTADGTPVVFALLVNNHSSASAQTMRTRMFTLLDVLK